MLAAAPAAAAPWGPFDPRQFEAAQRAGAVILLQFVDKGCSACEAQEKALSRMFWSSPRSDWAGFQVDLDSQRAFAGALRVGGRMTLILLRGTREIGRSVGVVVESELAGFLHQADIPEPRGRPPARPKNRKPPRP